jgi:hypothetical protein
MVPRFLRRDNRHVDAKARRSPRDGRSQMRTGSGVVTIRHRLGARALLIVAFVLVVPPVVAACGAAGGDARDAGPQATASMPTMNGSNGSGAAAAWAARPAYVRTDARTESAYAFALQNADVLQWMPCYCGCAAMDHRSNLDCFFEPTMAGLDGVRFEEHASYCEICVDIALMTKQLLGQGQSLRAIRAAVDDAFSRYAPGTPTELPPA